MEKLRQVLAQDDTVLFVGSGVSVWSGLPLWPAFIEELAVFLENSGANPDLVRAEARKGDLLQAASYGFDKLTPAQIGDFVRGACRYGKAKPHEIHQKLVSLGPRCFVTTNYDNLIEEALRTWQKDRFYPSAVTNRHLTELGEIVHARSMDFVFKPHGDAGDSKSIILTREQYRQLLPDGEVHAALESVKTLMVSRPVVYFGFGLRDPDFIYIRDLLSNTYKGGTRDHYAVMADVSDPEVDYWRKNYGIHIISYATMERHDGSRDHVGLLKLLDSLIDAGTPTASITPPAIDASSWSSDTVLALARHAAKLSRVPKIDPEYPIRVTIERAGNVRSSASLVLNEFDYSPVQKFLEEGPYRAVFIGLPGAGKSYSLSRAAAHLAEKLHQDCLSESINGKDFVVPVFADMKLYRGNLADLISGVIPHGALAFESQLPR